jgi:hypothetical protein
VITLFLQYFFHFLFIARYQKVVTVLKGINKLFPIAKNLVTISNIRVNCQRIYVFSVQKLVTKLWVRSQIQGSKKNGIPDPDPQH